MFSGIRKYYNRRTMELGNTIIEEQVENNPEKNSENIEDENYFDKDYEPSEDSASYTDYESNDELINENEASACNNSLNESTTFNLSTTANASGVSGCDDAQLTIDNSRSGTKKYYCFYCKLPKAKIARHLESVHRNEEDVKKFAALPKGCLERKKIIETIRRKGEFQFNTNKMLNDGKLHVVRRPNIKFDKTANEYGVCIKCHGFFSKNTLRNHVRKCVNVKHSKNRIITVLGRAILGRINEIASQTLKKVIFPVLREDSITRLIRYDELIIRYGNKLCMKYKPQHQHDMVRNRLRTLGRFLKALKEINNEITDFASLYEPKYYDDCIKAVYQVARYNTETQKFEAAYTAFQLGTLLKEVGELWRSQCIKNHDPVKKALVEDFLSLRKEDFSHSVNKTVMETRAHMIRQKKEVAPSISDIKKLYNYVNSKRHEAYNILKEEFSYNVWLTLGQCTLISMQIYNRKRAGEMQRILLEDFYNHESLNEQSDPDLFKSLSNSAKAIARKYVRFQIRGKLGRPVPVLLHFDLLNCIQLFIQCRDKANVHPKNPYVFGVKGFHKQRFKYLRACDHMRQFAHECGADHPERLRGTLLRKHIATNCHKLKLTEVEVSELADFMGHKENIHKQFYRLPQKEADILNITKYLEAALGTDINTQSDSDNDSNSDENDDYDNGTISLNNTTDDDNFTNNNTNSTNVQESDDSLISKRKSKITKNPKKLHNNNKAKMKCKRIRWPDEQKNIVLKAFNRYLYTNKCPTPKEIAALIAANPCLQTRTISQVKTWFNNQQKDLRSKNTNDKSSKNLV
ncbi:uncharacterized protein [Temnothorax nylanderi]|uniref:uncharacterized protein n=1 Tax=Temnothorax nylanderi TaxID=102681 RepID=UPI003A887F14